MITNCQNSGMAVSADDYAADDYAWVNDFSALTEAYCAVLVRGITVEDFLRGMRAEPQGDVTGYAELERRTWRLWEEHSGDLLPIGAVTVPGDQGEWVLGLETNGYLGVTPRLVEPLSRGTRLVSHFCDENAHDNFLWYEDGTLRTSFEPLVPDERDGSTPDELVGLLEEVGFVLDENEEELLEDPPTVEAAFALAERLTGVHITPDRLTKATYAFGVVPHTETRDP